MDLFILLEKGNYSIFGYILCLIFACNSLYPTYSFIVLVQVTFEGLLLNLNSKMVNVNIPIANLHPRLCDDSVVSAFPV